MGDISSSSTPHLAQNKLFQPFHDVMLAENKVRISHNKKFGHTELVGIISANASRVARLIKVRRHQNRLLLFMSSMPERWVPSIAFDKTRCHQLK
jgi:hypothetical protein